MATVVVTADNSRLDDCEDNNGFANVGGGPGTAAEAPYAYQGSLLVNRKITSSTGAGFYYVHTDDSGSVIDMTASRQKTWMVKCMVSDYNGLDSTDGLIIRLGSGTSDYYAYVIAGTDSSPAFTQAYRDIGGLIVIPLDPNENSSYNDTSKDSGTPSISSMDYFGIIAAFSASSAKNENLGLDAIDIGSGLYLVGGDGGSTDGVYQDFVDFDGGTVSNRFGYARNGDGGVILAYGEWRIGTDDDSTSTATEFTDSTAVVFWLDHLAGAGFSVLVLDAGNSSTIIIESALHIGAGDITNVDSRPDILVQGTSGSATLSGTYRNFRNVTLTSAVDMDGGDCECAFLVQSSAEIQNSIIRTNALTSVACLQDPTFGSTSGLHDTEFIQTGAGHAIEIDAVGSYTLTNVTFTSYGADTTDSAALDVTASSGTVTINVSGGNTPTFKTAGATVNIVNSVAVKTTIKDANDASNIQSARVYLEVDSGGDLPHQESVTITRSGSTATVSHTSHGMPDGTQVHIEGADQNEYNGARTLTVLNSNSYTFAVSGTPTTPATGTIIATSIVVNALTDASGVAENTGFNFTNSQPIVGWARKGTSSPRYKTVPISGSIESSVGFTAIAFMVSDD